MVHAEVVTWATEHYPQVLQHPEFQSVKPDGLTLSLLEPENFEKSYGPTVGPAFFKALARQGTPSTSFWHSVST